MLTGNHACRMVSTVRQCDVCGFRPCKVTQELTNSLRPPAVVDAAARYHTS